MINIHEWVEVSFFYMYKNIIIMLTEWSLFFSHVLFILIQSN